MEVINMITCSRCGLQKEQSTADAHLCIECRSIEANIVCTNPNRLKDWTVIAKECDLELWERQPKETDLEWRIWQTYRDCYPTIKPTYKFVAETLATTVDNVRAAATCWVYPMRMQSWAIHCDRVTMQRRKTEIVAMNNQHISMAKKLNEKIADAIERIDPSEVSPAALNSLLKTATDLERKARIDHADAERDVVELGSGVEIVRQEQSTLTKREDLGEIVDILTKAGVLSSGGKVGVKKTTTTEVISMGE